MIFVNVIQKLNFGLYEKNSKINENKEKNIILLTFFDYNDNILTK